MDFFALKKLVYDAPQYKTRQQMWHRCIEHLQPDQVGLEFGVWHGTSINYMAFACPDNQFHGFDSFDGLPEDWIRNHPKGTFKIPDTSTLKFAPNITLHKGWFNETVPVFVAESVATIGLIHIDCDLGSSATTVLNGLEQQILRDKPLMIFDEFYSYLGFEDHEFLSFLKFITRTGAAFEVVGRNVRHQQVLIQMK